MLFLGFRQRTEQEQNRTEQSTIIQQEQSFKVHVQIKLVYLFLFIERGLKDRGSLNMRPE